MKQAKWIRWAHRWVGLWFSIVALMASASGLIHLWMSHTQPPPPSGPPSLAALAMDQVTVTPAQAAATAMEKMASSGVTHMPLRMIEGEPWYQIFLIGQQQPVYVHAQKGSIDEQCDERFAKEIATTALATKRLEKTKYLTEFDREYIGIFRILPVYRFDANDEKGNRVYVSTVTGSVTRATDDAKQWEANVFSLLHKWMFIPNKNVRNYALGIATFGIFVTSLLGLWLFWVTRPKSRAGLR